MAIRFVGVVVFVASLAVWICAFCARSALCDFLVSNVRVRGIPSLANKPTKTDTYIIYLKKIKKTNEYKTWVDGFGGGGVSLTLLTG